MGRGRKHIVMRRWTIIRVIYIIYIYIPRESNVIYM